MVDDASERCDRKVTSTFLFLASMKSEKNPSKKVARHWSRVG